MDKIGKYRHRIVIKAAPTDSSRDSYGSRKGTGSTVATLWAEKTDWGGDETTEKGRETAAVQTKFRIRYRTDLNTSMTVEFESQVYDILAVMDFDGTKRETLLTTRKVVDA